MIIVNQSDTLYTLNLAPGEELVSVLINFCQEKSIKAAHIVGLGAASCVELAYYHLPTKAYERKIIKEDFRNFVFGGERGFKKGVWGISAACSW
jgi:predicted DNA-binding protein with PD1-like motif